MADGALTPASGLRIDASVDLVKETDNGALVVTLHTTGGAHPHRRFQPGASEDAHLP